MSGRVRRSSEEAKRTIPAAAGKRLIEGGLDCVRVQDIAADVGIAPATVLRLFGSREELLHKLLKHGARQLAARLDDLVGRPEVDLSSLAEERVGLYEAKGYALPYSSAERSRPRSRPGTGTPFFDPWPKKLMRSRTGGRAPSREEFAFILPALNLTALAEGSAGDAIRRSLGLPEGREHRARFAQWLAGVLDRGSNGARS